MAKAFEFADFIDEFAVSFTVLNEAVNGYYNEVGKWVDGNSPVDDVIYHQGEFTLGSVEGSSTGQGLADSDGETPSAMSGIILPLSNDELRYEVNGRYTTLDRKIYVKTPLKIGQKIEYNGQQYTIDRLKDYTAYADVYMYFARGVGSE